MEISAQQKGAEMSKLQEKEHILQVNMLGDVKGTFTIQIQYRENAAWQGKILWVEEKQSSYFRSALEMLKLMDSALDRAEKKEGADK